ncbi:MAG: hypothetical protein ACLPVY_05205 [Acidimicrobiia bacterium]
MSDSYAGNVVVVVVSAIERDDVVVVVVVFVDDARFAPARSPPHAATATTATRDTIAVRRVTPTGTFAHRPGRSRDPVDEGVAVNAARFRTGRQRSQHVLVKLALVRERTLVGEGEPIAGG